jgi:superfamily II DNA/RNA helicase
MFSATFSEEIKKLAANFLRDPVLVEVARRNATAENVTQEVVKLHESEKTDVLLELLRTRGEGGGRLTQVLVFVNSKIECRRLARQLQKAGVNADAIHGDKTQDERMKALEGFKTGTIEVLVATDVAARGLDIVELPVVINYDVPFSPEDYVHRIGRTGRAGATGIAIMMMTGSDERNVAAIERLTKQKFQAVSVSSERRERSPERGASRGGRERPERDDSQRGRSEPAVEPRRATTRPADDFFSRPYEPGAAGAEPAVPPPTESALPQPARPGGRVAALLGGRKK